MTKNEAKAFVNSLLNLRASATDEQAIDAPSVYPEWKSEVEYVVDNRVLYENVLYKVLQDHTSQETWTPTDTPSLFAKVLVVDENTIPEWEQPDSTNPYMKGDKVIYEGKTWESTVDNNVWAPGVANTWEVVNE